MALTALAPMRAEASLHAGDVSPNFTKTAVNGQVHSLYDYRGKVVVLFLFGYDCPYCERDGRLLEPGIKQYYQSMRPGEVQVLGADLWNGTQAQVAQFGVETGATYPLLMNGSLGAGNENLQTVYGHYDNYVVINKQGIIRYNAFDLWPHGNRYHQAELRACIDSLVGNTAGIGDGVAPSLSLSAAPNPFRERATIDLAATTAGERATVTVHDVAGRRVATLWNGPVAGRASVAWDGRGADGEMLGPGVYLVRAEVGARTLTRRIVRVR